MLFSIWLYLQTLLWPTFKVWGTSWRSWLMHCPTSRKVAGSISEGVIGIFNLFDPSGRTTALGSTQPLREMSTRNISWGVKVADAWANNLHVPIVLKSGSLNLLEPSGPVQGMLYLYPYLSGTCSNLTFNCNTKIMSAACYDDVMFHRWVPISRNNMLFSSSGHPEKGAKNFLRNIWYLSAKLQCVKTQVHVLLSHRYNLLTPWSRILLEKLKFPRLVKNFRQCYERAVPWLRRLVAGLSPRRPGFDPRSSPCEIVVDKVALGQVFLRVVCFPLLISFHRCSIKVEKQKTLSSSSQGCTKSLKAVVRGPFIANEKKNVMKPESSLPLSQGPAVQVADSSSVS
jgi:hypothetical protein